MACMLASWNAVLREPRQSSSEMLSTGLPLMPLIELTAVRKVYEVGESRIEALKSVSLTIERGEYVAVIGPSGSGKSTLMNTLGCLDRPSSGSYLLDGEEIVTMTKDERAVIRNRHLGFVFQNFNLLARTPAVENVELPLLYARGMTVRQRRERAIAALTQVGLADRLHHHPSQLSGGQQQRVAIARALVNNPSILMGDEPTGNLDSKTGRDVIRLFRELNRRNHLTVIVVTHDHVVARQADRVIVMHDGEVLADSTDFDTALRPLQALEAEQALHG